MPKALSLKKSSQSSINKNQKAITQFFRTDNAKNVATRSQNVVIKDHETQESNKQNIKRKADCDSSPTKLTSNDFFAQESSEPLNVEHAGNKSKKQKSDQFHSQPSSVLFEGMSPKKCVTNKCLLLTNSNYNVIENSEECRTQLSPLKLDLKKKKTEKHSPVSCSSYLCEKENDSSPENAFKITTKKSSPPKNMMKSPKDSRSPRLSLKRSPHKTPEKPMETSIDFSPSKRGSTVRVLTYNQNDVEDIFDDDWDIEDEEDLIEDLDLSTMQRCEVLSIAPLPNRLELRLKNENNNRSTCFIEGVWTNTPLREGEIVSILATRNSSGQFVVTNTSGFLALRPDHLISTTSVVAGVFCKRKAVLQERWRGIDAANTAMTIGILIHELVQAALTRHIASESNLRSEADAIIRHSTQMLYDAGLTIEEARSNMQQYIQPLAEFMQVYVKTTNNVAQRQKDQWNGNIEEVLDIEENVCCPKLGLKGKIDATLQVTIHEQSGRQRAIVPLELKSGKASVSAEHRGQLVLYCMMLSLQRCEDPSTAVQRGLLLYLRDRIDLREVSCGYPERRDLMMLRNELVQHLAAGPKDINMEQLADIEEASSLLQQSLPDPVNHENACTKCPYLTICSLHLWHTNGPTVSERHPLTKLRSTALGHLSAEHINYFKHWTSLLKLEEREQMTTSPLHSLWTESADKRSNRGTCMSNLKLKTVKPSGDRYEHVFEKGENNQQEAKNSRNGPQEGEFSIVSIENRPWIAAGVVTLSDEREICIVLERDLSRRLCKDTIYSIDTYESYATTVHNLTNLGVLVEDSDRALRLRRLIIDKEDPQFAPKLHRSVGRLGAKLMRSLNIEQQRAVLRALAAEDYSLLRGLPGTGKTQTISVLIQMLVGLGKRVLVTAHTHSAVDTVLSRLPETVRVMRLGSSSRVAPSLQPRCEGRLAKDCTTPESLAELYDSMDVVGVTCLGATHAMLTRTVFDICIVDEATQVLQCTVLRPLFAAKCFVLVGDPEQLPPVVKSRTARRLGMEESLFHRLMSESAVSTLRLQYRMNQPLVDVANRVAYNGTLKCADQTVARARLNLDVQVKSLMKSTLRPTTVQIQGSENFQLELRNRFAGLEECKSVDEINTRIVQTIHEKLSPLYKSDTWILAACSPEPEHAAVFLSMPMIVGTPSYSKDLTNVDEACVVLALVEALKQGGVISSDIGIIAPYRDQVSFLRRSLTHLAVEVSTVDQFQGRDKSVIIYSCAKREDRKDEMKVKDGEVLNDQRRLAVSVTRAKHKLIVVGSKRALRRYDTLQPLIEACETIQIQEDVMRKLLEKYKTHVTCFKRRL